METRKRRRRDFGEEAGLLNLGPLPLADATYLAANMTASSAGAGPAWPVAAFSLVRAPIKPVAARLLD